MAFTIGLLLTAFVVTAILPSVLIALLQPVSQHGLDTDSRLAVPQFRCPALLAAIPEHIGNNGHDLLPVVTNDSVGTLFNRDWSFGVVAERDTGHTQYGRLFLQPAGICHDQPGIRNKPQHFQIAQWLQLHNAGGLDQFLQPNSAIRFRVRGCIGNMTGTSSLTLRTVSRSSLNNWCIVNIGGPVQRQHTISVISLQIQILVIKISENIFHRHCQGLAAMQGIDHDITDMEYPLLGYPLLQQIFTCRGFGYKQQFGELIRQHPVDLLRHGTVITAQPGLNMNNRDTLLGGHQRTGNR